MNGILRLLVIIAGIYAFFRYRYRIMNQILGVPFLRKMMVAMSMNIPYVREKFIRSTFQY